MPAFFDINTIAFTLWGYPMSYLELSGVSTGSLATWLVARNNVWTWPLGVVSTVLSFFLLYQVQLYPDMLLQGFFFITFLQGWYRWTHPAPTERTARNELRITRITPRQWGVLGIISALATALLGTFASHLHTLFPVVFSKPSAFPYLDSFTSTLSIIGTLAMVNKKLECWWIWLLIDAVSTYIYYVKGVRLVSLEYAVFCIIAVQGLVHWTREYGDYQQEKPIKTA